MEKLRLKIASDLHDEVGSSLSQISINADMINYETNFEKIKSKSEFIRMKSGEMISTMNDVIWSIDSRNDNLINLVDRIKTTSLQFASSKNIKMDIDIRIENNERKLNVDFRQNLFLIIKEAVNNSIKHSGANCIELKFYEKNGQIKIIISDNGSGLPPSLKETGNGLKNIIHRSEKIKGKLEFINSNGLRIELEVNIT
jgi:signal transduction histidine kinase